MSDAFSWPSLDDLRRRTSIKWRMYPADVLPLWVAEMDVPLAEPIIAAVTDALTLGDTGYPSGGGYVEAIRDFAAVQWDWHFDVANGLLTGDVMAGITFLLRLLTEPGDAVVISPPIYPPFRGHTEHADRRIVEAPLTSDHRLDLDNLRRAFGVARAGDRPAIYLMSSPHNPTGTVYTTAELTAVAALGNEFGVRVVVDEIHAPLVFPEATFVPYLSVPGAGRGFALHSASKAWNLAGIKSAVLIAGEDASDDLARLPTEVPFGASHLGVIAHTAAVRHGVPWRASLLAALDANRRLLGDLLAEHLPAVHFRPPEATYLAWLDCRDLGLGDDPAAAFLERGRVAVNSGLPFGAEGAGHVRLNFATSPEILTDAVRRMASVRP